MIWVCSSEGILPPDNTTTAGLAVIRPEITAARAAAADPSIRS